MISFWYLDIWYLVNFEYIQQNQNKASKTLIG